MRTDNLAGAARTNNMLDEQGGGTPIGWPCCGAAESRRYFAGMISARELLRCFVAATALFAGACRSSSPASTSSQPDAAAGDGASPAADTGTLDASPDTESIADLALADRSADEPDRDGSTVDGVPSSPDLRADAAADAAAPDASPDESVRSDAVSDGAPGEVGSDGGPGEGGGDAPAEAAGPVCPETSAAVPPSCASLGVVIDPYYAGSYTCHDLGPVPGLPAQKYGGLTLLPDRCSTQLLIGGDANLVSGKLYRIQVTRDRVGHINGFSGSASAAIDAPFNEGVAFGPAGVLFVTRWPANELQQTRPGSTKADKVIDLTAFGVAFASAGLDVVADPLPSAGALKLLSWSAGQWYDIELRADRQGTYDLGAARQVATLAGGPTGFAYVQAGSPLFPSHALLVSEWSANKIASYEVDGSADPKVATRRDFITGLQGAEGAFRDPATGDFFFSTWGQAADRVIVVRGFAPTRN